MNLFPKHVKQEPLALPLALELPAHRNCMVGKDSGGANHQRDTTQSTSSVATTLCACVSGGTLGNPKTAKPSLLWSESTLAALSVNGARALHALIVGATPIYIDLWLRAQTRQQSL